MPSWFDSDLLYNEWRELQERSSRQEEAWAARQQAWERAAILILLAALVGSVWAF